MAGMEALGRLIDCVPVAAGLYINMKDCSGITFFCTSANSDTFAFGEAQDKTGTGAQLLADGTKGSFPVRYYENSDTDGSLHWVKHSLADDTTGTITTGHVIAVDVLASMLDDTFNYVYVTPSSTGTVIAVLHDLAYQRTPANLSLPGE
jgi:hypothetical protein